MTRLLFILISLLLCGSVFAETERQLFNPAAKEYILGNTPVASNLVTQALAQFPDSEKLQKLKELIEQQQEQQDQQNQERQENQDSQDPKDQDPQDSEEPQDSGDQDSQEPDEPSEPDIQEPQEANPSQAAPQQAGEMSEEEAQQLLDAMKQNENDQRQDLRPYLGPTIRVDKDW
jgi:hypothetical protein